MGRNTSCIVLVGLPMLSFSKLSLGHQDYFMNLTTGAEDYHINNGGEPGGRFLDTEGARLLGLSGIINREQLTLLFQGYDPTTGQPLVQNAGKEKRFSALDITLSPGKHYSVYISLLPPHEQKIGLDCFSRAHEETIKDIEEKVCFSRCGKGGCKLVPAKVIAASFEHSTSRALDPHFHIHTLLINVAFRPDGTTGSLDTRRFYDSDFKKAYGAFFRNALKNELRQHLGIDAKCRGFHLELPGISQEVCRHFSKRRREIEDYMNQRGLSSGKAAAYATLQTRQKKTGIPSRQELYRQWQQEAAQFRLTPEQVKKQLYQIKPQKDISKIPPLIDKAIDNVLEKRSCFNRDRLYREAFKTCSQHDVKSQTITTAVDHKLQHSTRVIKTNKSDQAPRYTTEKVQKRNIELAKDVNRMLSKPAHSINQSKTRPVFQQYQKPVEQTIDFGFSIGLGGLVSGKSKKVSSKITDAVIKRHQKPRSAIAEEIRHHLHQIRRQYMKQQTRQLDRAQNKKDAKLTVDQQQTNKIRELTADRSRISILRKGEYDSDRVLRVAREVWEKSGYTVMATSLSKSRVAHIEKETGIESMTLKTLFLKMNPTLKFQLSHHKRQLIRAGKHWKTYGLQKLKVSKNCVLIVDNADSLSFDQMRELINEVDKQGGKLVLVQGQSLERARNSAFHAVLSQLEQRDSPKPLKQITEHSPPKTTEPTPPQPERNHEINKEISL